MALAMALTLFIFLVRVYTVASQSHLALLQHRVNLAAIDTSSEAGHDCEKAIFYARTVGIVKHPQWYPGLTTVSSPEEFKLFHAQRRMFSCDKEWNHCTANATWAKWIGIKKDPSLYPGLDESSTVEQFKVFFAHCDRFECKEDAEQQCVAKVKWAMDNGIQQYPEYYPGLTPDSSFAQVRDLFARERRAGCDIAQDEGHCCERMALWAKNEGIHKHPTWYSDLTPNADVHDFKRLFARKGLHGCLSTKHNCSHVGGMYWDHNNRGVKVTQTGCDITAELTMRRKIVRMNGKIEGSVLKIPKFRAVGEFLIDRNLVLFSDRGLWSRQPDSPANTKECDDFGGKYLDKSSREIRLVQAACDIVTEVKYGGEVVRRMGKVQEDMLTIEGFKSAGSLSSKGDVKFPDGGLWTRKQPEECWDFEGKYVDHSKAEVRLYQDECDVTMTQVRGDQLVSKSGKVQGDNLTIDGVGSAGQPSEAGDIEFVDGARWTKVDGLPEEYDEIVSVAAFQPGYPPTRDARQEEETQNEIPVDARNSSMVTNTERGGPVSELEAKPSLERQDYTVSEESGPSNCSNLNGKYWDHNNRDVIVKQTGCSVITELTIRGKAVRMTGVMEGAVLKVPKFRSDGNLFANRNIVVFDDGGLWSKQPKHVEDLRDCTDFGGKYTSKANRSVKVVQAACDVVTEVQHDDRAVRSYGKVDGNILRVDGFKTPGSFSDMGDVEFGDGGIWSRKESEACADFEGKYMDQSRTEVFLYQDDCEVTTAQMAGDDVITHIGRVNGTILSIDGFISHGELTPAGDVTFNDGGQWSRLNDLPEEYDEMVTKGGPESQLHPGPDGCSSFVGKYYDRFNNEVDLTQDDCDATITSVHDGHNVTMQGRASGATLHVQGFSAVGSLSSGGDVEFADGGRWSKQPRVPRCATFAGKYYDKLNNHLEISQTGCEVLVDWDQSGRRTSIVGSVDGDKLQVAGFASTGVLSSQGGIDFADGGHWPKQPPSAQPPDMPAAENLTLEAPSKDMMAALAAEVQQYAANVVQQPVSKKGDAADANLIVVHKFDGGANTTEQVIGKKALITSQSFSADADREHRDVVPLSAMPLGHVVPLTEAGYKAVAAAKNNEEMATFIQRVLAASGHHIESRPLLAGLVPFYSGARTTQSLDALLVELGSKTWVSPLAPESDTRDAKGKLILKECQQNQRSYSGEAEWMSDAEFCMTFDCSKRDALILQGYTLARFDPDCAARTQYRLKSAYLRDLGCSQAQAEDPWYPWQQYCVKLAKNGESCLKAEHERRADPNCPVRFHYRRAGE